MTKILDFPTFGETSFKASDGGVWHLYEVHYEYQGQLYAFEIMAKNMDEALDRVRVIRNSELSVHKIIEKRE